MALRPDLTIIRGDTTSIDFELTDGGDPVDLTGATVFFTAKSAIDADATDAASAISVEVTSHTNPTAGETLIPLTASDTTVTPGEYFYDVQVKNLSGTILSIPYRKLEVVADVTRRTS